MNEKKVWKKKTVHNSGTLFFFQKVVRTYVRSFTIKIALLRRYIEKTLASRRHSFFYLSLFSLFARIKPTVPPAVPSRRSLAIANPFSQRNPRRGLLPPFSRDVVRCVRLPRRLRRPSPCLSESLE